MRKNRDLREESSSGATLRERCQVRMQRLEMVVKASYMRRMRLMIERRPFELFVLPPECRPFRDQPLTLTLDDVGSVCHRSSVPPLLIEGWQPRSTSTHPGVNASYTRTEAIIWRFLIGDWGQGSGSGF